MRPEERRKPTAGVCATQMADYAWALHYAFIRRMSHPKPPPTWLALIEPARVLSELGVLLCSVPWLSQVPRGDGHPATVIYSPSDGVVAQDVARLMESRYVENVPVHSSHLGFAMNPLVYRVIAERLALSE
jgi:hypothetical protein